MADNRELVLQKIDSALAELGKGGGSKILEELRSTEKMLGGRTKGEMVQEFIKSLSKVVTLGAGALGALTGIPFVSEVCMSVTGVVCTVVKEAIDNIRIRAENDLHVKNIERRVERVFLHIHKYFVYGVQYGSVYYEHLQKATGYLQEVLKQVLTFLKDLVKACRNFSAKGAFKKWCFAGNFKQELEKADNCLGKVVEDIFFALHDHHHCLIMAVIHNTGQQAGNGASGSRVSGLLQHGQGTVQGPRTETRPFFTYTGRQAQVQQAQVHVDVSTPSPSQRRQQQQPATSSAGSAFQSQHAQQQRPPLLNVQSLTQASGGTGMQGSSTQSPALPSPPSNLDPNNKIVQGLSAAFRSLSMAASQQSPSAPPMELNSSHRRPTAPLPDVSTPLHIAAQHGRLEDAKHLFKDMTEESVRNALLAKDAEGRTPLHIAAREGHADVAELLIHKSAELDPSHQDHPAHAVLNAQDAGGRTPLHFACKEGHPDVVCLLLDWQADVCQVEYEEFQTPLHITAVKGFWEIALLLVHAKDGAVAMNAKDKAENTPLMIAKAQQDYDMIYLLCNA